MTCTNSASHYGQQGLFLLQVITKNIFILITVRNVFSKWYTFALWLVFPWQVSPALVTLSIRDTLKSQDVLQDGFSSPCLQGQKKKNGGEDANWKRLKLKGNQRERRKNVNLERLFSQLLVFTLILHYICQFWSLNIKCLCKSVLLRLM